MRTKTNKLKKVMIPACLWVLLGVVASDPLNWVESEPTGLGLFTIMTGMLILIAFIISVVMAFEE